MSSGEFSLTTNEAMSFLRQVLGMSSPEHRLQTNRESFLADLVRSFHDHLHWQSFSLFSTPSHERHIPTAAELKRNMFAGLGGVCYDLAFFGLMLLRALGFQAELLSCGFLDLKDLHACTLVKDLTKEGSRHLIDFGNAYPSWRVFPLDFQKSSPEYHDSFLRYRFVLEDGVLIRQHRVETDPEWGPHFKDHTKDGWYNFFYIHVNNAVDVSYFHEAMETIYSLTCELAAMKSPMLFSYSGGRLLAIRGSTLMIEDEGGVVRKTYFRSIEEITEAFSKHFPQFSLEMIKAALKNDKRNLNFEKGLK